MSAPRTLNTGPEALRGLGIVLGIIAAALIFGMLIALKAMPSFRVPTLLLLAASAVFMLAKPGDRDLLHPVRVFGALWCFCLAFASMRLLPLQSEWKSLMWSCVLTALISFIAGFWLSNRLAGRRNGSCTAGREVLAERSMLPNRRALILAVLCFLIGASVLAYEYHLMGGIPIFSDNPDEMRSRLFGWAGQTDPQFDRLYIKLLHPFVEFIKYGTFLAVIVLCQRRKKTRNEVLLGVFLVVAGTLLLGSQAGRVFFINVAVTSIVLYHYLRERIRLRQLGATLLILFAFLGLFGSIRTKASNSGTVYQTARDLSGFPDGEIWDGAAFGYMTLTLSFETFSRLTEDWRTMQHPAAGYLFYAFHRLIPRSNIQELANDSYAIDSITSTFLGEFFADYGYWGVLFGPLLLGLAYGWAYSQAGGGHPIYWIYVRAMLIQILFFFPYVNLFSMYTTWLFDLIFMYFIVGLCARWKEESPSSARPTGTPLYSPA